MKKYTRNKKIHEKYVSWLQAMVSNSVAYSIECCCPTSCHAACSVPWTFTGQLKRHYVIDEFVSKKDLLYT